MKNKRNWGKQGIQSLWKNLKTGHKQPLPSSFRFLWEGTWEKLHPRALRSDDGGNFSFLSLARSPRLFDFLSLARPTSVRRSVRLSSPAEKVQQKSPDCLAIELRGADFSNSAHEGAICDQCPLRWTDCPSTDRPLPLNLPSPLQPRPNRARGSLQSGAVCMRRQINLPSFV